MHSMVALRRKCYLGLLLAGGIAGTCEQGWAGQLFLFNFFLGIILVGMAAFLGGLCGFIVKNAARCAAKRPIYTGQNNDGMLVGGLLGALIGILLGSVLGMGLRSAMGGGIGAYFGAMLGAMLDEFVGPIMEMLFQTEADPAGLLRMDPLPADGDLRDDDVRDREMDLGRMARREEDRLIEERLLANRTERNLAQDPRL